MASLESTYHILDIVSSASIVPLFCQSQHLSTRSHRTMATLHRPTLLNSVLSPFITTLSLILFITTTAASPVLSSASNSIIQLAGIGPAACEEGSTSIGKQFPRPRPGDCSSLAGQLRYDPTASDKTRITGEEHFLRGSGTCQLYIYTTHDGSDADEVTLNELADGVDKIVQECVRVLIFSSCEMVSGWRKDGAGWRLKRKTCC